MLTPENANILNVAFTNDFWNNSISACNFLHSLGKGCLTHPRGRTRRPPCRWSRPPSPPASPPSGSPRRRCRRPPPRRWFASSPQTAASPCPTESPPQVTVQTTLWMVVIVNALSTWDSCLQCEWKEGGNLRRCSFSLLPFSLFLPQQLSSQMIGSLTLPVLCAKIPTWIGVG